MQTSLPEQVPLTDSMGHRAMTGLPPPNRCMRPWRRLWLTESKMF